MPITLSEATMILLQVRRFYKRGEKSSNKRYHLRAPGPLTRKQYTRNRNVDEIDIGEAAAFLDYLLDKYSAVGIGWASPGEALFAGFQQRQRAVEIRLANEEWYGRHSWRVASGWWRVKKGQSLNRCAGLPNYRLLSVSVF